MTIQEKELIYAGTLYSCTKVLNSSEIGEKSFIKLYENIIDDKDNINLNLLESFNQIKLEQLYDNKIVYFKKVIDFINNYRKENYSVTKILNETLNSFDENYSIETRIKDEINRLEKLNDIKKYSSNILKNKILLGTSINVFGFDITKNLIEESDLHSILFDKLNNQIIYVTKNYNIITYNILTGELKKLPFETLNNENYLEKLNIYFDADLITIYRNINTVKRNFTDNLYSDVKKSTNLPNKNFVKN